jgi:hypothetical protein
MLGLRNPTRTAAIASSFSSLSAGARATYVVASYDVNASKLIATLSS